MLALLKTWNLYRGKPFSCGRRPAQQVNVNPPPPLLFTTPPTPPSVIFIQPPSPPVIVISFLVFFDSLYCLSSPFYFLSVYPFSFLLFLSPSPFTHSLLPFLLFPFSHSFLSSYFSFSLSLFTTFLLLSTLLNPSSPSPLLHLSSFPPFWFLFYSFPFTPFFIFTPCFSPFPVS